MMNNPQHELVKMDFRQAKSYALEYQGMTPISHFFNTRIQRVSELLSDFTTGRVLDVGCGPGIIGNLFRGRPIEYHGMDISGEMIKECICTFGNDSQFHFAIGKIEELPFAGSCFDVVLCLGAFEYVVDPQVSMKEIVRVLNPKGIVIISMKNEVCPYTLWQEFVYWKIINQKNKLLNKLAGRKNPPVTETSEITYYREKDFRNLMISCGLLIEDIVYYDFNLFISPLDTRFLRTSVRFSRKLERLCRSRVKFLGTGYILKCRKNWPEHS